MYILHRCDSVIHPLESRQYFTNPTWILLVTWLIMFVYSGDTCSHLYIDLIANFNYLVNLKGNSLCKLSVAFLFTKSITKQFTQTVAWWSSLSFSYLSWRDSDPKMPHFSRFPTTDDEKKGKRIHVLWFPKAPSYLLAKVSIWRYEISAHSMNRCVSTKCCFQVTTSNHFHLECFGAH